MENKTCGCNKKKCTCKKPLDICYEGGCEEKISAECVIYKPTERTSFLKCFLGISTKTSLETILERLDSKLCTFFTFNLNECGQGLLQLPNESDFKSIMERMLYYLCNLNVNKVKVSESDSTPGYLFDKIIVGECVRKQKTLINGAEHLILYLDFNCIAANLPTCVEVIPDCITVDINGGSTSSFNLTANKTQICGQETATLTATNCSTGITWYKDNQVIVNNSNILSATAGVYYAVCNGINSNAITITNTGDCNSSSFTYTRTQSFTKNDCNTDCTGTSVSFSKTYTSSISQAAAQSQATNDLTFVTSGQALANLNGTCINCSCVPTDVLTCNNLSDKISFYDSCGFLVNAFSKKGVSFICDLTDNLLDVTIGVNPQISTNSSTFTYEYKITKVNNVAQTNSYQSTGVFNNLQQNTDYEFETKISKNGIGCTLLTVFRTGGCTSGCTSDDPAITITSNKTEVCNPDNTVLFNVVSSTDCDEIEWYSEGFASTDTLLGTGNSLSIAIPALTVIKARCINCKGNAYSNSITITNTGDCNQTTYTSTKTVTQSGTFTPACATNCTPVPATVTYQATNTQTRTSTISQQEADDFATSAASLAAAQDVQNNGQTYANNNSTCDCPPNCISPTFNVSSQQVNDSTVWIIGDNIVNGTHAAICEGSTFTCGTNNGFDIASSLNNNDFLSIQTLFSTQSKTFTVRVFNTTSNCFTDKTITVTNTTAWSNCPTFTFTNTVGDCNGVNTKDISIGINSTYPPYTHSLDGGAFVGCLLGGNCDTFNAVNLALGSHTLTVRDSRGCEEIHNFTVVSCVEPCVPINITDITAGSALTVGSTVTFTPVITGTTPITNFNWTVTRLFNNQTTNVPAIVNGSFQQITLSDPGVYTFSVTAENCSNLNSDTFVKDFTVNQVLCTSMNFENIGSNNESVSYINCNNVSMTETVNTGMVIVRCVKDGTTPVYSSNIDKQNLGTCQ